MPPLFAPNQPLPSTWAPAGGWAPSGPSSSTSDPYEAWFNSPIGQRWNTAKEAEATQARKVADFEMAHKKRELDARVAEMRRQGRVAEAELELKRGDQQIARERLAAETRIREAELRIRQRESAVSEAEARAKFMSGPDTMFQRADFESALTRAMQGLGPEPYGAQGSPTPRSSADFDALMSGSGDAMRGSGQMPSQGSAGAAAGQAGAGNGTDPRVTAATGVLRALPPSDISGVDENDRAALAAVESIFRAARPGTLQRMRPGQRQAFSAGLSRLGYWAPDSIADMQRSAPGQGNPRLA